MKLKAGCDFGALLPVGLILAVGCQQAAKAQPNFEGIWAYEARPVYSTPQYTPEGQRRVDSYDVLTDDPSYECIPSGLGRAWDEPDTAVKIEQYEDRVVISYEMFDLVRTVELNKNGHPLQPEPSTVNIDGVAMPTMGHSIGWYEDDELVMETVGYDAGYVTTLRQFPPQSEAIRSLERLRKDGEDRLVVEIAYVDPLTFTEPLTATHSYFRSEFDFIVYGCIPGHRELSD